MSYIDQTLKRASIQSLSEYLLYGVSEDNYTTKSYEVRLRNAYRDFSGIVKEYDSKDEESKLHRAITKTITECEHVYMELGIQAGFRLAKDISRDDDDKLLDNKYREMYSSLFEDTAATIEALQNR